MDFSQQNNKYEIKKPLVSYQKFNEKECSKKILALLREGKNGAVISDAGTPILSDPGAVLVQELISSGEPFTAVPGANAVLPALILSGLDSSSFTFIGFLPEKDGDRQKLIESFSFVPSTLVFYSAPHDLKKTLAALYKGLGARKAVAVKELTKLYEKRFELVLGQEADLDERGEFVILVEGAKKEQNFESLSVEEHIKMYVSSGMSKMEAIKQVAKERGVPKSSLYKYTINEK